jgi:plasmid stabilization system protein ParE
MPRVKLSALAQRDLIRLHRFLAERDLNLALRAIETIQSNFAPLEKLPFLGRPIQNGLRELIIDFGNSGYVALYHLNDTRLSTS